MTGRNATAPSVGDFTSWNRTSYQHDRPNNRVTATVERKADSGGILELFTDISFSRRSDGRLLRQERQLNGVAYEVTTFDNYPGSNPDPYDRKTSRMVNGVLQESWSYPAPAAPGAVTAVIHSASDGTCTLSEYDVSGRIVRQNVKGATASTVFASTVAASADVVSDLAYASRASGLAGYLSTLTETAGGASRVTQEEYDGAGRLVWKSEPNGRSRYHTYGWTPEGGSLHSVRTGSPTNQGLLLSTYSYHRDGTMLSTAGPAEVAAVWDYTVPSSYRQKTSSSVAGFLVQADTVDGFGRTVSTETPVSIATGGTAVFEVSQSGWDSNGRLQYRSRNQPGSGSAYEVWSHNPATGEVLSGLSNDTVWDVNDTALRRTVTTSSIDGTVAALTVDGTSVSLAWKTVTRSLPTATGTGWETTPALTSKTALAPLPVAAGWSGHFANAIPQEYRNDGGTVYTQAVEKVWSSGVLATRHRVLRSGGQYRRVVSNNGIPSVFSSPEASNITLPYNAFREPLAEMSWGTIPHWPKLEIEAATGNVIGHLLPDASTYTGKFTYFNSPSDHRAGRVSSYQTWTYQPSSQEMGTTYYHYDALGQTLASYGPGTTPSAYTYDAGGRMTHLRTWRNAPSLNPGNIDADLAAAETAATVQTTQWTYSAHPTLSLVRTKTYPGRPIGVDYTYASDGSLATRDWERTDGSNRLRTTYLLDNFGRTSAVHYGTATMQSFGPTDPLHTPSVLMDYDRAGRLRYRTDAAGTVLLQYRYDGSLLTETTVAGAGNDTPLASGRHLRRTLDSSGRLSNLESSWGSLPGGTTLGSATISPTVDYFYGTADRLSSLSSGGMTGYITRTATTDAFSMSAYPSAISTYNRTLKSSSTGLPSNHLAQMNGFTMRNTGFTWDADRLLTRGETDLTWNYGYDSKSQVAAAHKKFTSGGEVAAGTQSVYNYDAIGNRTTLQEGGTSTLGAGLRTTNYKEDAAESSANGANALNQYARIERPQTFDVIGRRSSGAEIKVNGTVLQNPDYQPGSGGTGLYFRKEVDYAHPSCGTGQF